MPIDLDEPLSPKRSDLLEVTLWVCPKCGYFRDHKSTGVHTTDIPPSRFELHHLVPVKYIPLGNGYGSPRK